MARNRNEDTRLRKEAATSTRGSRAQEDQARSNDEGTALSVEDRRRMIRNEFAQEALPQVPPIPGYHLMWLSTTNSYDPIHKRMRLGYEPVSVDELLGFESFRMGSGEFAGCVACNEMLLFKIREDQYQAIMAEFHHNMPLEEEEALKAKLKQGHQDSEGQDLESVEGDGFERLVDKRRVPSFA